MHLKKQTTQNTAKYYPRSVAFYDTRPGNKMGLSDRTFPILHSESKQSNVFASRLRINLQQKDHVTAHSDPYTNTYICSFTNTRRHTSDNRQFG